MLNIKNVGCTMWDVRKRYKVIAFLISNTLSYKSKEAKEQIQTLAIRHHTSDINKVRKLATQTL